MEIWRKLKVLGAGSYGTVFLACGGNSSHWSNSALMAVKSSHLDYGVTSLQLEASFLKQLQGKPNIVQCFGEDISLEGRGILVYNLLLEFASGGSLADLIKNTYRSGRCMPEPHIACYASMILRGLAQIHSQGIVHCDLKPANILVFPVQGGGGISQLKLADFGVARRVSDEEEIHVWDGIHSTYNRGTPLYASPESVALGMHQTCADIWSFGCIVFEMITGKTVWKFTDMKNLFLQILLEDIQLPAMSVSKDGLDFLEKCLARDCSERWSAEKLLEHPFIVNNLKIIHGLDLNTQEQRLQKSPFGVCGWVSKRHLFSEWVREAVRIQEQQRQQQQQFQPYNLFPVQQSHQSFQFPCGEAVVNLPKNNNVAEPIHHPDGLCGKGQANWLQV